MAPMHRRDMLKTSAVLGAGVWLSREAVADSASPNEKLNIACIGVGGRGEANVKGVSGENLVAFCDVDEQRAAKAYNAFPKVKKFTDYRKMFDAMEMEIDAVVVSTPDHTHFHPSMMAMERGMHLYCEKPMAHSVEEVRRMTEKAAEKKVATQLGVQRHTISNMHRVVELIRAKAIGDVTEVHSWVDSNRGMPGDLRSSNVPDHLAWDLWLGPGPVRDYSSDLCPYKWRFWWDYGTGETGNWGCHILDIPVWALDLKAPTRVGASGPEPDTDKTPKEMSTRFQFPADKDRPAVTLHWSQAKGGPAILKQHGLDDNETRKGANTLFIGTKGMLLCGFNKKVLLPKEKFADYDPPEKTIPNSPGFHREWIDAAKGGPAATCDFVDYSGPLTEVVLLGNVAYRAGGFDWDAKNMQAGGNTKAERYLISKYRKGWII